MAALAITGCGRQDVPATVVRLPVPYGPGQTPDLFIGGACAALRTGQRFRMSPGEQTRDFLYLDDGIEALLLAAENISVCRGEILNACSGVAITLREAIRVIGEIAGQADFADVGALAYRPREQMHYVGDPSKIRKLLGWSARTSFAEGIRQALAPP
jgi:nucleoside-diphosphate-sugar epimerase